MYIKYFLIIAGMVFIANKYSYEIQSVTRQLEGPEKKKEDKKEEVTDIGELKLKDLKELALSGGSIWAIVRLLQNKKVNFWIFFILTWQYIGGGFFTFFLAIPITMTLYVLNFLFKR